MQRAIKLRIGGINKMDLVCEMVKRGMIQERDDGRIFSLCIKGEELTTELKEMQEILNEAFRHPYGT